MLKSPKIKRKKCQTWKISRFQRSNSKIELKLNWGKLNEKKNGANSNQIE